MNVPPETIHATVYGCKQYVASKLRILWKDRAGWIHNLQTVPEISLNLTHLTNENLNPDDMNKDVFLKVVLALIAVNLTILTLMNLDVIPHVKASAPAIEQPAINYGLIPLNDDGSLNVSLNASEEIKVNITNIDTWDELKVDVREFDADVPVEIINSPLRVETD